jgi:hypothetical protein
VPRSMIDAKTLKLRARSGSHPRPTSPALSYAVELGTFPKFHFYFLVAPALSSSPGGVRRFVVLRSGRCNVSWSWRSCCSASRRPGAKPRCSRPVRPAAAKPRLDRQQRSPRHRHHHRPYLRPVHHRDRRRRPDRREVPRMQRVPGEPRAPEGGRPLKHPCCYLGKYRTPRHRRRTRRRRFPVRLRRPVRRRFPPRMGARPT